MILTFEEVKNYIRVDFEEDDPAYKEEVLLINTLMVAAENYLRNATGKEYPETDKDGNKIEYALEKVYLKLLIANWYENRSAAANSKSFNGKVPDAFTYATQSLLLQLQL